ncbi:MAG: hypothetical protein ACRDSP_19455, partial [Pseudonocardiaceae bacterium]
MTATPAPGPPRPAGQPTAPRPAGQPATAAGADRARRRSSATRLGPLPLVNLVVLEIGIGAGLVLLAADTALWWAAVLVLVIAGVLGLTRWRGRWLVLWLQLFARYQLRTHDRSVTSPDPVAAGPALSPGQSGGG